jgi:hypothetical protein
MKGLWLLIFFLCYVGYSQTQVEKDLKTQDALRSKAASESLSAIEHSTRSAADSAQVASEQAKELQALLEDNYRSTVVIQLTSVGIFILGFIGTWLVASRDRKWAKDDAAERTRATEGLVSQMKQVHTLVNSNMTEAKTRELDALRAQLVLLENEALRVRSEETNLSIRELKIQIVELAAQLADRLKQTKIADADSKQESAK